MYLPWARTFLPRCPLYIAHRFVVVASAGYIVALLRSVANLNHDNPVYLGLGAHDAGLLILLSGLMLFTYHRLFPWPPFDWRMKLLSL